MLDKLSILDKVNLLITFGYKLEIQASIARGSTSAEITITYPDDGESGYRVKGGVDVVDDAITHLRLIPTAAEAACECLENVVKDPRYFQEFLLLNPKAFSLAWELTQALITAK